MAIAAIALATPAEACRANLPPAQRIEASYSRGLITAVALVRVSGAKHTSERSEDMHPWMGSADVAQILSGSPPANVVRFGGGWGSAACSDDGTVLPRKGDLWVIYFAKDANGKQQVRHSYPVEVATEADPRIRSNLRQTRDSPANQSSTRQS